MITNSKKDQLAANITSAIFSTCMSMPYGSDRMGPVYTELKGNIEQYVRMTVHAAFRQLLNDLYTQEQFEKDIGLKS